MHYKHLILLLQSDIMTKQYSEWKTKVDEILSRYFSRKIINKYNSSYEHLFNNNQTPQEASDYLYEYINDSEDAQRQSWFDLSDFD